VARRARRANGRISSRVGAGLAGVDDRLVGEGAARARWAAIAYGLPACAIPPDTARDRSRRRRRAGVTSRAGMAQRRTGWAPETIATRSRCRSCIRALRACGALLARCTPLLVRVVAVGTGRRRQRGRGTRIANGADSAASGASKRVLAVVALYGVLCGVGTSVACRADVAARFALLAEVPRGTHGRRVGGIEARVAGRAEGASRTAHQRVLALQAGQGLGRAWAGTLVARGAR